MSTLSSEGTPHEWSSGESTDCFTADDACQLDDILGRLLSTRDVSSLPPTVVRRLLSAGSRIYTMQCESENVHAVEPIDAGLVTPTQVATVCMGMLKAVNLEVFELTLWGGALSKRF